MPKQYPQIAGHVKGSQSSFDAATKVEKRGKVSRELMIYNAIRECPRSVSELGDAFGLPHEVISPRCGEMRSRGLLGPTGEKRKTKYGNPVDVLQVIAPYSRKSTEPKRDKKPVNEKLKDLMVNIQLINTKDAQYQNAAMNIVRELIGEI